MDYIIIVAGGKGLRMGSDIPKQFLPIGGKPVLMRTLERFRAYSSALQIILVLSASGRTRVRSRSYSYYLRHNRTTGDNSVRTITSMSNIRSPTADRPVSTLYRTVSR